MKFTTVTQNGQIVTPTIKGDTTMKRELPDAEFITVKEDAYSRAEELASFGFAVAVYNDGHIFRIETQEDFQPCTQSQPVCFS